MLVVPKNKAETVIMAQSACDILGEQLEVFGFDRYGDPLFQTLGFADSKGKLLCVVIAYHYTKPNVTMAFAADSPRWATRGNIEELGKWAFEDLDCQRVTAFVKKTNRRARKFDEGIGFKYEGNLRKAADDSDIIIYGLFKEEHLKWVRKANGRKTLNDSRGTRPEGNSAG